MGRQIEKGGIVEIGRPLRRSHQLDPLDIGLVVRPAQQQSDADHTVIVRSREVRAQGAPLGRTRRLGKIDLRHLIGDRLDQPRAEVFGRAADPQLTRALDHQARFGAVLADRCERLLMLIEPERIRLGGSGEMMQLSQRLATGGQRHHARLRRHDGLVDARRLDLEPDRRPSGIGRRCHPQGHFGRRDGQLVRSVQLERLDQAVRRHVAGLDQGHQQQQENGRTQRPGITPRQIRLRQADPQARQHLGQALLMPAPERRRELVVAATGEPVADRAKRLMGQLVDLLEPTEAGILIGPAQRRPGPRQRPKKCAGKACQPKRVQPHRQPRPEPEQADDQEQAHDRRARPDRRPECLEGTGGARQAEAPAKRPALPRVEPIHAWLPC